MQQQHQSLTSSNIPHFVGGKTSENNFNQFSALTKLEINSFQLVIFVDRYLEYVN